MNSDQCELLKSLIGTTIKYNFDVSDLSDDDKDEINDTFQRSKHFSNFVCEDDIEIDAYDGTLSFEFNINDYETVENLIEYYNECKQKINSDIIDDVMCLANCEYGKGLNGFCSKHKNLGTDDISINKYKISHSDFIKQKLKMKIELIEDFIKCPLDDEFYDDFCDDKTIVFKRVI